MKQLCVEYADGDVPVRLFQAGFDRFIVEYGKSIKPGLDYADAAKEFGQCVMHSASCASKIDNRTKAEARKAGDNKPFFDHA